MTSLNRSRRRAEHFAALVDATRRTSGWDDPTAADRLDRELVELLQLVTTLRDHPAASGLEELATPRPSHTVQLRERLMTEAADVLTPERAERHAVLTLPPRHRGARERRLAAAATVLVVLGGTAGMASAAERALPGQALYPVKRSIERVDVVLSTSTAGKGRDVLHQASTRLDEVKQLAEGPLEGQEQIPDTMKAFAQQAHEGAQLMITAYKETADPSTLQTVQAFAQSEGDQVEALARTTSVVEPASLQMAATTLDNIQDTATETCQADCPVLPFNPVLLSGSTDVSPPSMRAADGTELGTGQLPTELGTVPPTGDGSTVDATAPTDGSAVDSLPGLTSDPASTSPLPPTFPIPGLPDLGGDGGTAPGTGTGTGSGDGGSGTGTDPGGDAGTGTDPGDGGSSPSSGPTDTPSSTPTPSDPSSDPPVTDPTPTDTTSTDPAPTDTPSASTPTESAPDGGGDSPSASGDPGQAAGAPGSGDTAGDAAP